MRKLNLSVLNCLNPSCGLTPHIQLDSQGQGRMGSRYTAGQALVCEKDIQFGKEVLEQTFPGLTITEVRNPGWLLKEQRRLKADQETLLPEEKPRKEESPVQKPVKDENTPASDEELQALRDRFKGMGRRR